MSRISKQPVGLRGKAGRQLGDDLLGVIFKRLDAWDLATAELVCRHWKDAIRGCGVWQPHAEDAYGNCSLCACDQSAHPLAIAKTWTGFMPQVPQGPQPCDYLLHEQLGSSWRDMFLTAASWRRICCSPLCTVSHSREQCTKPMQQQAPSSADLPDRPGPNMQQRLVALGQSAGNQEQHSSWVTLPVSRMPGTTGQAAVMVAQDNLIAVANHEDPQTVRMWDVFSSKLRYTLKLPGALEAAAFAGTANLLVTACSSGRALLWKRGSLIHSFTTETGPERHWHRPSAVSVADGTVALCEAQRSGAAAHDVKLYDILTGRLSRVIRTAQPPHAAMILAEGPAGSTFVVSASRDCHLALTDSVTGASVAIAAVPRSSGTLMNGITTLAYDNGSHRLFFGGCTTDGSTYGTFDDRMMGSGLVWIGHDNDKQSRSKIMLPPWGSRDCCLLMPTVLPDRTPHHGRDFTRVIDLRDGQSMWGANLKIFDSRHGSASRHNANGPGAKDRQAEVALMHNCITYGSADGLARWHLPTWQNLLSTSFTTC